MDKTTMIRVTDSTLDRVHYWLEQNHLLLEGMSSAVMVETFIAEVLDQQERMESKPRGILRSKIAKWAETAPFYKDQLPHRIDSVVQAAADTMEEPLAVSVEMGEFEDEQPEPVLSDKPPWETCPRISIERIEGSHPKHKLLKWCIDNPLKVYAVEATFAVMPTALLNKPKAIEVAEELFKQFTEWREEHGQKDI